MPGDYKKKVPSPFLDELPSKTDEEVKAVIVSCAMDIERIDQELRDNATIKELQENLKELKGPYTDTKKTLRAKIRFCREVLCERGKA